MSLTSYRAAPPRVTVCCVLLEREEGLRGPSFGALVVPFVIVMGFYRHAGFNAWRRPTLPTLER